MPANAPPVTPVRSAAAFSPWTVRGVLALDAVVTTGNGLAYLAFAGPLGSLFGVGLPTLLVVGLLLTCHGLVVGALAARRPPRPAVLAVVGINTGWVLLSLVALAARFAPTVSGTVWIPLQAAAVALFVVLQLAALRRSGARR
ncbi:hypothetical protein ACIQWA_18640 [Kitasatospora sp. NPDC098652]|uniref:hypothetical protein n=1 Tax=Kitasatospora sp. NPDC098652 TaxID=3364095 RepID=UPI0037F92189